ncbi:MAG: NAD(P)-dependent oxidoreductase [Rhizobacter sp.]
MRIAVTGGSGFIGSNTVDLLLKQHIPVLNIDAHPPRDPAHTPTWAPCDLLDGSSLKRLCREFDPTHVVHLAARTDLRGQSMDDYGANVDGVRFLMEALDSCPSVERVIFASSMLVCRLGHVPSGDSDYSPTTPYGQSKVAGEKLVKARMGDKVTWAFARPCSIWGPGFGEPYRDFFLVVLKGRFIRFGPDSVKKTFGYVGNTVYQLMQMLSAPAADIHRKMFYLGDGPPTNAGQWAVEIARLAQVDRPKRVPLAAMRLAAHIGDGLGRLGITAPMTTFRLNNMITDNVIDLSPIHRIAPHPPYDLERGIRETLAWIAQNRGDVR